MFTGRAEQHHNHGSFGTVLDVTCHFAALAGALVLWFGDSLYVISYRTGESEKVKNKNHEVFGRYSTFCLKLEGFHSPIQNRSGSRRRKRASGF